MFDSILSFYIMPSAFDIMVFSFMRVVDKSKEYPYKKLVLLSSIPILNIIIELFIAYQVLKESHKFIFDKKYYKFTIALIIVSILFLIYTFASSILLGIITSILFIIATIIMIKG